MEIRLISDLHWEFYASLANEKSYPREMLEDALEAAIPSLTGDLDRVLVLAGDISSFKKRLKSYYYDVLFPRLTDRFKYVVYVPGNHELYGCTSEYIHKFSEQFSHIPNLHFMDKGCSVLDGVRFIGATLWSDMEAVSPVDRWRIKEKLNDYRAIRTAGYTKRISIQTTMEWHYEALTYIRRQLQDSHDGPTVIVTHHAPSSASCDRRWANDPYNGTYFSDQSELIYEHKPELWLHGHTHGFADYEMDQTRVVCNPYGYMGLFSPRVNIKQTTGYVPDLVLTV